MDAAAEEIEMLRRPAAGHALVLVMGFAVLSVVHACAPMMYPLERAFGGPKESELKQVRLAFTALKTQARNGAVVVYRPMVVRAGNPSWDEPAGVLLVDALHTELATKAVLASAVPGVPYKAVGNNKFRHFWNRAALYAAWVKAQHPAGDHFMFTELLADPAGGRVFGAYCYIVDATGQIAFAHVWSTQSFAQSQTSLGPFLGSLASNITSVLAMDPLRLFPPYGVG
jgi:hypothetical protein